MTAPKIATPTVLNPLATRLARIVFNKRGNHSEAHLTETELAVIIHAGIEVATSKTRAKLDRLGKGVERDEHHGQRN